MSLTVQRDGEIAAVAAVDAPLPTPATKADPTLPSSKYLGITPTNAQTSLLRHKEGNPCSVSIFKYHVCISTRPSRTEKNRDRADEVTTIPVEVM